MPRALGAAVLLCAALLGGCGEDMGPFTVTGVTKPQYIAEGDAICAEGERQLDRAAVEITRARSGNELARVVEQTVVPVVRERIDRLRALEPPPGDEAEVAAIYDAGEAAIERVEARPALAENPDQVLGQTSRLARQYGFRDCAGG